MPSKQDGRLKILVVGPVKSGKTAISNTLMQHYTNDERASERFRGEYRPTSGVRILEFECGDEGGPGGWDKGEKTNVELWDCSGDTRYEECWPAIMKDASGVIIVYNPEDVSQSGEVENWYDWFIKSARLPKDKCVVLQVPAGGHNNDTDPPRSMRGIKFVEVNVDIVEQLSDTFDSFVSAVLSD